MTFAIKKILTNPFIYVFNFIKICAKNEKFSAFNPTSLRLISNMPHLISGHKNTRILSAVLPKNMSLQHCSPAITSMDPMIRSIPMKISRRPLTVILSWMLAKDNHLEKYRQLWFGRGFDVLTVKTSPIDLLLPPIGGRIVASNLVKYLIDINPCYNEIVIHAFSVGGYQFCELLTKLKSSPDYKIICDSIKGVILDSPAHAEEAASGLSRAVTKNPILQSLLEVSILSFLTLFHSITTENYRKASEVIFNNHLRCPGLILYSKDDIVSNVKSNEKLAAKWVQLGISTQSKCWSKSTHVLHYRDHRYEYEGQLDLFLRKLKLLSDNCE